MGLSAQLGFQQGPYWVRVRTIGLYGQKHVLGSLQKVCNRGGGMGGNVGLSQRWSESFLGRGGAMQLYAEMRYAQEGKSERFHSES
jgi:hypothetical protein